MHIHARRQIPKLIKKTGEKKAVTRDTERRKEENRREHSKAGAGQKKPERATAVMKEVK